MKRILLSLLLSFLLALLAYIKKAMTRDALILAFVCSFFITFCGGISSFLILTFVFLGTIIASKIGQDKRNKINQNKIEKSGKKDILEIIANVATGTLTIIIYGITKNEIFLIMYDSIMAESLADSLASDIGVLSKKKPINIKTLKIGEPGLSGNISLLGLISSLIGSFIIGLLYFIFNRNIYALLIITICGFLGALFDSYLGAFIQVKYKCPKCGEITEQKIHCKTKTEYCKGNKKINNDLINLLSNIFSGLISYLILMLF